MKTAFSFIALLTYSSFCSTQIVAPVNLVPNASFEQLLEEPTRWMTNKYNFEQVIPLWTSPNLGSPDVLVEGKMDKLKPNRKNVDLTCYHPHSGKVMIGIKTWGCQRSITHCKEYIQVKLMEPLEAGHVYDLVFWIGVLQNSVKTNNLGFGLYEHAISDTSTLAVMDVTPICYFKEIISPGLNEWVPLRCRFKAPKNSRYLLIGNFFPDEATLVDSSSANLPYSYYFIDDVSLRKVSMGDLLDSVDVGENTIEGDAVFFEFDKADLLPASNSKLLQLADWLESHPNYRIEIVGPYRLIGGRRLQHRPLQAKGSGRSQFSRQLRHCPKKARGGRLWRTLSRGLQRHRGEPQPQPPSRIQDHRMKTDRLHIDGRKKKPRLTK